MNVDEFMYDLKLNDKDELIVLISIPKDMQNEFIENVEIRITETDIRRMQHVFRMNTNKCEDCGKPWKLGDPSVEVEESRIKCLCEDCY